MATIAKTVGSFDKVLATCKQIGAQYQPNVASLSPAALSKLHDRAQQLVRVASQAQTDHSLAVQERQKAFADVTKLSVRIVRILSTSTQESAHLEAAKLIRNRFYSPRKKNVEEDNSVANNTRASGRMSYDQQLDTFTKLVDLIATTPAYSPVEPELAATTLRKKVISLRAHCQNLAEKHAIWKLACLERDQVVFGKNGIVMRARAVRDYIKGAFGSFSQQAAQISSSLQL
ncbi:MAG TPA: hypothetical protein VD927_12710 [Chryseosolibacter sp.]|nr:hypothetical protein [Chryseosolibacter sp.]